MSSSRGQRLVEILLVAAATVWAAFALKRAPYWVVDDAWIVARYADHFVATHRFAWNIGEPPVEGFTSLLAMLVAVGATWLHMSAVNVTVGLCQAAYLSSGALVLWLGRSLRAPAPAAGMIAVAHLVMAEHVTHATSGLETELYLALCLLLATFAARALRGHSVVPLALVGFLVAITRPEGMAAAGIAILALTSRRRAALAWFGVPLAGVFAWRFLTFGALVPNTYFAKRAALNAAHLRDLWTLVNEHYVDLFVVSVAIVVIGGLRPFARAERRLALAAVAIIVVQAFAYLRAEPVMDYAKRFAMNDVPWLDVLALVAVSAALRARRLGVLFAIAVVTVAQRATTRERFETSYMTHYEEATQMAVIPTAHWVDEHVPKNGTVAVYPDAGMLPYLTKRRTIDFGLLNDPKLARAHSPAEVVAYFYEQQPDVLVVSAPKPPNYFDEGADAIVSSWRFPGEYELGFKRGAYRVFVRKK